MQKTSKLTQNSWNMLESYNIYYVYTNVIKHHIKIQGDISRDFKEEKKQVKLSKHFQLNTLS